MSYIGKETRFTWLGHSTFLIEVPSGRRVLVDPWLSGNPSCPEAFHDIDDIATILITHGHFDHITDCVDVAKRTGARVVSNYEISLWLARQGLPEEQLIGMNKGGTVESAALRISMTHACHSSSIQDGDQIVYAGEAAGFVCETENEFRFYIAGDTCVFGDMKLIGEMHAPELAILPIGDLFTMGPREAAKAAHLLGVKVIIPCHFGTYPPLTGTPEALRTALGSAAVTVHALEPGQSLE